MNWFRSDLHFEWKGKELWRGKCEFLNDSWRWVELREEKCRDGKDWPMWPTQGLLATSNSILKRSNW